MGHDWRPRGDVANELLERIAVALEARSVAPTQDTALSILNQENEHLRAEIATLKALNAGQHAANVAQRQELAMLRPLLVDGAPSVPGWPAPQPIETAPDHGKVLLYAKEWGGWNESYINDGRPPDKAWTHWLPMPPPPGGAA